MDDLKKFFYISFRVIADGVDSFSEKLNNLVKQGSLSKEDAAKTLEQLKEMQQKVFDLAQEQMSNIMGKLNAVSRQDIEQAKARVEKLEEEIRKLKEAADSQK